VEEKPKRFPPPAAQEAHAYAPRRSSGITDRVEIFGSGEYDTRRKWENSAGVEYIFGKKFSVVGCWHSEFWLGRRFAFSLLENCAAEIRPTLRFVREGWWGFTL